VGTTNQACGESRTEPDFIFKPVAVGSREQTHKTVASIDTTTGVQGHTPTEYFLTVNGAEASLEMSFKVALGAAAKLDAHNLRGKPLGMRSAGPQSAAPLQAGGKAPSLPAGMHARKDVEREYAGETPGEGQLDRLDG
jgi:hypothetical protein